MINSETGLFANEDLELTIPSNAEIDQLLKADDFARAEIVAREKNLDA